MAHAHKPEPVHAPAAPAHRVHAEHAPGHALDHAHGPALHPAPPVPPTAPPDHLALLPWMDDYVATAHAAPAVARMHAHMASLSGSASAAALVTARPGTRDSRDKWQFLNTLDRVDDPDARHAMMASYAAGTGGSLADTIAHAAWPGARDAEQARALISPERDAAERDLAAMTPAARAQLTGRASSWAGEITDVTRAAGANDDNNAQKIARVLGPRTPAEIEAIRTATRTTTNGERSIYEELDRSLSGGNEDKAVAGLSGDPVHAASIGLVNAKGDPVRTREIMRGVAGDPAQLAALKERNKRFGTSWIADALPEGAERDEIARLVAGDQAGANAERIAGA
jgi:hypothetical protein